MSARCASRCSISPTCLPPATRRRSHWRSSACWRCACSCGASTSTACSTRACSTGSGCPNIRSRRCTVTWRSPTTRIASSSRPATRSWASRPTTSAASAGSPSARAAAKATAHSACSGRTRAGRAASGSPGIVLTLKVLAALLVYPEQELVDSLGEMVAIFEAEGALPKAERRALAGFIADLCGADLMDAQARYVALFDHSRSLSLHLYEHSHGEIARSRPSHGQPVEPLPLQLPGPRHLRAAGLPAAVPGVSLDPAAGRGAGLARPGGRGRGAAAGPPGAAALALCRRVPGDRGARPSPGRRGDDPADCAGEAPDDTPAALDRAWEEAPVTFGSDPGAAASSDCSAASAMVARFAPPPAAGSTAHRSGTR